MIKLKWFKEEWVDGLKYKTIYQPLTYYEIYKNPTRSELKQASRSLTRGIILKNGELYIIAPSVELVHMDLIQILNINKIISNKWARIWWQDNNSLNEFIGVIQSQDDLNKFKVSFSYYDIKDLLSSKLYKQYQVNFKKENPNYSLAQE